VVGGRVERDHDGSLLRERDRSGTVPRPEVEDALGADVTDETQFQFSDVFHVPIIAQARFAGAVASRVAPPTDQRGFARPAVGVAAPDDDGAGDAGAVAYYVPTDDIPPTEPTEPIEPTAPTPVAVTPAFTG